ncbi:MAG: L-glutamate gamma-semialdehyde dehydrogenase [Sphingomonadaceae bacterium]
MINQWDHLDTHKYADEDQAIAALLEGIPLDLGARDAVRADAIALVAQARLQVRRQGVVESFLQEFSLGTKEGLALMCLAEALLRTPDAETRDRLIAEKISAADWGSHLGQSDSLFVNASTWGLMLTGKLVEVDNEAKRDVGSYLKRLTARIGEPVIREAVAAAVRMMGEQFVLGRTIAAALKRAQREGYLCSFDMLGEGARTAADAARYETIYADAIEAVGTASGGAGPELGHGVSVKLSALCPRYEAVQEARVWDELYPRVKRLALIAARHNLNFAIDAEEADRLTISLKLIDRLAREGDLGGWQGLGVVVQAYQKRGLQVIEALATLARETERRIMVRLVKGAYWDSEIKRAQIMGRPDYPVFTTKAATDLSYLVCAKALIDAAPYLYPQFATHNAHTLAAVRTLAAAKGVVIEHQRLHGMGEALYRAAQDRYGALRLRAYAPVGGHEELLPYLVRRLLENGANTSFVHLLLDDRVAPETVVVDPFTVVEASPYRHPKIPLPSKIYGASRENPVGRDYSIASVRASVAAVPLQPIADITPPALDAAIVAARVAQGEWNARGGGKRATVLRAMAGALEANMDALIAILAAEAGKTLNDGVSEVREAIDFCRYYAGLAETQFGSPEVLTGAVGETNTLMLGGRGVFACISPWNFPLAIFTGQIAAALAAGNAVIAKPAEQTPFIAAQAVALFHAAGLPRPLLSLAPGEGATIGAALCAHPGIDGVAFTGGTETAWAINRALAARPGPIIPLIAETGGLNGMFVDTTALKEQVVDDVIASAFGSAGQRCSALRILFLPVESADEIIETIKGAMDALVIGNPLNLATDIGPVIDAEAKAMLDAHVERLVRDAKLLHRCANIPTDGHFFAPTLAEISAADFLEREVFGPILHIVRYKLADLPRVAVGLAARRYGLTLGIHSRIDKFIAGVQALVPAGNVYVNRSMTGAVVGVQPFGGEGLSGTGPKAGGPHALLRYANERAVSVNITAQGGDPALLNL